jgi:UDP-glucuronate 4-epimerase
MKMVLTGVAGFIGAQTTRLLLDEGHEVIGLDNLNDYYDPQLKRDRLSLLDNRPGFRFVEQDVADTDAMLELTASEAPDRFVHLAAQAGVRYSLENPMAYVNSNLVGFANVLEACRQNEVPYLVYASSSSVYGNNPKVPFSEHDAVDHPLSLYAASKRANELMAHGYSHLYNLPATALRFFTVYGPWGRPDMAPIKFARAIDRGESIPVYNRGNHQRDFTYIDDIADGVVRVASGLPVRAGQAQKMGDDPAFSTAPFRIYNVGNSKPVHLMEFIATLEKHLGKKAQLEMLPVQAGDVLDTWADCSDLEHDYGYKPGTSLDEGIARFVQWFRSYYD